MLNCHNLDQSIPNWVTIDNLVRSNWFNELRSSLDKFFAKSRADRETSSSLPILFQKSLSNSSHQNDWIKLNILDWDPEHRRSIVSMDVRSKSSNNKHSNSIWKCHSTTTNKVQRNKLRFVYPNGNLCIRFIKMKSQSEQFKSDGKLSKSEELKSRRFSNFVEKFFFFTKT